MDDSTFDTLTRALTTPGARRRALGALLVGSLGLLGRGRAEEADAHDLKATCKKKSGKARKKCLKKAKKHAAAHVIDGGDPGGGPDPVPCATPCSICQTCSDGQCVPNRSADNAICDGTGRCLDGECNPQPECTAPESGCLPEGTPCCSGGCTYLGPVTGGYACLGQGEIGDHCHSDIDCGSQACIGYRCRPCTSNGAFCANAPSSCCAGNNQCTGNGNTTCEGLSDGSRCTSAAQCASRFGCTNGRCGSVNA